MAKGELNVIFHGQFAFVFTNECVEVLVPVTPAPGTLGSNECRAGSRGGPIGLTRGYSYCLTGVTPSKCAPRFWKEDLPVLEVFRVINRAANALFCALYLPLPAKMAAQRCIPGGAGYFFLGPTARNIVSKRIALVNTFTFEYPNHAQVHLGDLNWTPDPGNAVNKNLHVFSSGQQDTDPQAGHAKEAFKCLVRLFPAMQLELVNEPSSGTSDIQNANNQVDDDLRSLAELRPDAGGLRAQVGETPHCVSLFVDNT